MHQIEMRRGTSVTKYVLANCRVVYAEKLPPEGAYNGPSPLYVLYEVHVTNNRLCKVSCIIWNFHQADGGEIILKSF